ncbi:hypothetical protein IMSAG249_01465 [Lachnospiraceae bacterium]|nr:hypothetical protein IMSAG249_01465 [Lachnospiraceae bacterium]
MISTNGKVFGIKISDIASVKMTIKDKGCYCNQIKKKKGEIYEFKKI